MLSSDGVHPTASGAKAMYKQILKDFTEIKEHMGGIRIRVATFNTGNFTGAGLSRGSAVTIEAYRKLMESVNADLWGLQEDEKFTDNDYPANEGTLPADVIYKTFLPNHEGFFTTKFNGKAFLTHFDLYDVEQIFYPAPETSYPSGTGNYGHKWFLTGKITVDGKEISIVSLHFDWNCKERRATQIKEVIKFAKEQEYCIIMGDFNPEDYVNNIEISKALFYEEELALFREIGMTHANAGEFGTFDTIVEPTKPELYGPWDNIIVSSNIKLLSAKKVYVDWMIDHAIVVAEMEIN
jgi:endonuclease/exonuclease/phosphatase family metal-dependent hydrolase